MTKQTSNPNIANTVSGTDNPPEKPALAMSEKASTDTDLILDGVDRDRADEADSSDPYDIAMLLLKMYRAREKYRPSQLDGLGESGWNILLELFICGKTGRKVSVSDVMLTTGFTNTSVLRYIRVLEDRGLICGSYSQKDKRILYLTLSDEGHSIFSKILPKLANEFS